MHRYTDAGIPVAPEEWPDEKTQIYYRLANELQGKKLLFVTDLDLLNSYTHACWIAGELEKQMVELPVDISDRHYNNLMIRWRDAVGLMNQLGGKFGFNPVDKSKVRIVEENESDPLKAFLDEGK